MEAAKFYRRIWVIRRPWTARVMQVILVLGGIEWARTLLLLVTERQAMDRPWGRLAVILGVVVIFTFSSALVFRCKSLRKRYNTGTEPEQHT